MPISLQCLLSVLPSLPPPPPPSQTLPLCKPHLFLPLSSTSTAADSLTGNSSNTDRALLMSTCFPSLAHANVLRFKSGYYNVQVVVGDDEPEEAPIRRFRRAVLRAGVIQECRRRMFFEDKQAKRKRKAREAARKNRKHWPYKKPKSPPPGKQEASKEPEEEEEDNWELPQGELPY